MIDIPQTELFIETGTFTGNGVEQALELGFKYVISIELSERYYNLASERFQFHPRVKIIRGDSYKVLPRILKNIDCQCTFWLDAHYSGSDTAVGDYNSPLLYELDAIRNHHIKTHTILIDDLRCWTKDTNHFEYDKTDPRSNGFDVNDILDKIYQINKAYKIKYLDGYIDNDVLLAEI